MNENKCLINVLIIKGENKSKLINCQSCVKMYQVLEEHEYELWLKRHLLAENSIENQEELLQESAKGLETNLTLLGRTSHLWAFTFDP